MPKRAAGWFQMADSGAIAADAAPVANAVLAGASLITLAVIATDADGGSLAIDDLGCDNTHPRWVGTVMSPTPNRRADQIENLYALRLGSAPARIGAAPAPVGGREIVIPAGPGGHFTAGGSIARFETSWNRWFWITSRIVPTPS